MTPGETTIECRIVGGELLAPVAGVLTWLRNAEQLADQLGRECESRYVGALADELASSWLASAADQLRRPT
jgi:hypothetical protein